MTFSDTVSLHERRRRGRPVSPPNNWHAVRGAGGVVHGDHWMCLYWDVERKPGGPWRVYHLYRNRAAENALENRDFATAEAAMRAVDAWCDAQWC